MEPSPGRCCLASPHVGETFRQPWVRGSPVMPSWSTVAHHTRAQWSNHGQREANRSSARTYSPTADGSFPSGGAEGRSVVSQGPCAVRPLTPHPMRQCHRRASHPANELPL